MPKRGAAPATMALRRKAISDPLRLRIIGLLGQSDGMTANDIASRVSMNPNRLYYHLRTLEQAGVVEVVGRRAGERMVESVYGLADVGRYLWDPQEPEEMSAYLAAQLEVAKLGAEDALFAQARQVAAGEDPPIVTWGTPSFLASRRDAAEFARKLDALQREFRDRASARRSKNRNVMVNCAWLVYESPAEPSS